MQHSSSSYSPPGYSNRPQPLAFRTPSHAPYNNNQQQQQVSPLDQLRYSVQRSVQHLVQKPKSGAFALFIALVCIVELVIHFYTYHHAVNKPPHARTQYEKFVISTTGLAVCVVNACIFVICFLLWIYHR